MANVHPYITMNNTKKALDYYQEVLGATDIIRMSVPKEQAEQFKVSASQADKMTLHSQFQVLGTTIMASDNFEGVKLDYLGISIMLDINSEDNEAMKEAELFWKKLSKSGRVTINMPFEEQFWGGAMGDFTDEYGVHWMLHAQPYSKRNNI